MGKEDEVRVCRVHDGVMMVFRPDGFHCLKCQELAAKENVIVASCPHCYESLLVPRPLIEGLPSVCLQWQNADEFKATIAGLLYVSSRRDSVELISVPPIERGEVLRLSCPRCMKALPLASDPECRICGARVVVIDDRYPHGRDGRSKRWVCSRCGCPGHHFGEEGPSLDAQVVAMMAQRRLSADETM